MALSDPGGGHVKYFFTLAEGFFEVRHRCWCLLLFYCLNCELLPPGLKQGSIGLPGLAHGMTHVPVTQYLYGPPGKILNESRRISHLNRTPLGGPLFCNTPNLNLRRINRMDQEVTHHLNCVLGTSNLLVTHLSRLGSTNRPEVIKGGNQLTRPANLIHHD